MLADPGYKALAEIQDLLLSWPRRSIVHSVIFYSFIELVLTVHSMLVALLKTSGTKVGKIFYP